MRINFVNRNNELNSIEEFCSQSNKTEALFLKSERASGLTRFYEELGGQLKNRVVIPVDGLDRSGWNIYSSCLNSLYSSESKLYNKFIAKELLSSKKSKGRLVSSALMGIPFVGSLLGEAAELLAERYGSIKHEGFIEDLLSGQLVKISKEKDVLFLIDNVQSLDNWSLEFLHRILENREGSIKFVLGQVSRSERMSDNEMFSEDKIRASRSPTSDLYFRSPNGKFVKEIFESRGIVLSIDAAEEKAFTYKGNIYKVLADLLGKAKTVKRSYLQQWMLQILMTIEQPVRLSDLVTILIDLPTTVIPSESQVLTEFEKMVRDGVVLTHTLTDSDILIRLVQSSVAEEAYSNLSLGDRLFLSSFVYEYYLAVWKNSLRHSKSETALLLYRLSQKVEIANSKKHALDIVRIAFSMGAHQNASKYVSKVVDLNKPTTEVEFFTSLTFYLASKEYLKALQLVDSSNFIEMSDSLNYVSLAKAICLERCRNYQGFNQIIQVLKPNLTTDQQAILSIYEINAAVHQNCISHAKSIFQYSSKKHIRSSAYPYLLRSATSLYHPSTGVKYLEKSLAVFKIREDKFGYWTTMANLGLLRLELNQVSQAIELLQQAKNELRVFGTHHTVVVLNNLGIAFLKQSEFKTAAAYFEQAMQLTTGQMPRIYLNINLAVVNAFKGNAEKAQQCVATIEESVVDYPVDRVRQRYYSNLPLIQSLLGFDHKTIKAGIQKMQQFPDRRFAKSTFERSSKFQALIDANETSRWADVNLFTPCYLEYWYTNPLDDLSVESLPKEALV